MGIEHEANGQSGDGLTPRCGYCGTPLVGMHSQAQYCNRRCKELAREKRRRERERVDAYRAKYPEVARSLRTFDDAQGAGHDDDNGGPGEDDALPTDPRYMWESIASRYEGRSPLVQESGREALQALGSALPGHRYRQTDYRGRATHDIWRW
jgi:hypothetical protein